MKTLNPQTRTGLQAILAWSLPFIFAGSLAAESVVNSKHNLSVSGPGSVRATSETGICVFCHIPGKAPVWNRYTSGAIYTPYSSSTTKATIGQPTGSSKLCLSCHDGTVALGMVKSQPTEISMLGGSTMPVGNSNLTTNLDNDHPISFVYDEFLRSAKGELHSPSTMMGPVRLEDGEMQCTSCHDPHDNQYGNFLVVDNIESALCVTCHDMDYWSLSEHRVSPATWDGLSNDPWPHTEKTSVRDNACESCHRSHSAGMPDRLLISSVEEDNCLNCHNGHVASANIKAEFAKISTHPIYQSNWVHDPTEDLVNPPRHVECSDCHNPHASFSHDASAPAASGALEGVAGITSAGTAIDPLQNEYELCFRCHGDSIEKGAAHVSRQIVQTNTRIEFDPANASHHAVVAAGKNPDVPSLIRPWTEDSQLYCTDCHNNDRSPSTGNSGPNGPHGSAWRPILERRLVFTDNQPESEFIYALCYKCHSRESILADDSFKGHRLHVDGERTACTTCHDSHGVSSNTHLINFNLDYVSPEDGIIEFVDDGRFAGNCTLSCHGYSHQNTAYGP
jgi:predicted CXXCH cytochrome family protein